jgi:hypothetical protein
MVFHGTPSEQARKNYLLLADHLKRVSYKPGWTMSLVDDVHSPGTFMVTVTYDSYESEKAVAIPLAAEDAQLTTVRRRLGIANGGTFRKPEKRHFARRFDMWDLHHIDPEMIVRYIIVETIKMAEAHEFERWFKIEGCRVFGE